MTTVQRDSTAQQQLRALQISGATGGATFALAYGGHALMKRDMEANPTGKLAQKFPIGFSNSGVIRGAVGPGLMMATAGLAIGELQATGAMPESNWSYAVAAAAGGAVGGLLTLVNPIFHGRQLAGEAGRILASGVPLSAKERVVLNVKAGAHSVPINVALGAGVGAAVNGVARPQSVGD